MSADKTLWLLSAYYWSPYLSFAVLDGRRIVALVTHRLRSVESLRQMQQISTEMINDYAPDTIVLEADSHLFHAALSVNLPIAAVDLTAAKRVLLNTAEPVVHEKLFRHLLEDRPELQRLASLVGERGTTANTNRRRASQLSAVALGLAFRELSTSRASLTPSPIFRLSSSS